LLDLGDPLKRMLRAVLTPVNKGTLRNLPIPIQWQKRLSDYVEAEEWGAILTMRLHVGYDDRKQPGYSSLGAFAGSFRIGVSEFLTTEFGSFGTGSFGASMTGNGPGETEIPLTRQNGSPSE
jgi:hypothetical protein